MRYNHLARPIFIILDRTLRSRRHEHVVELLVRVASFHVEEHETKDGATALTFAASKRQTRIVDMLSASLSSSKTATATFP